MEVLSAALSLGTLVLGFVLAVRLLRLAARTHKAPELAMGLYCLLVTTGALLLGVRLLGVPAESPAVFPLSALSTLCIGLAAFALAVGIGRIFRPGVPWARGLALGIGLWIGASWLACVLPGRPVTLADVGVANASFVAGRVVVYALGAIEAFRYAAMLRRQVALGLAEQVVPHQIRLWGIAWLCVAGIAVGSIGIAFIGGQRALESPVFMLVGSTLNASAWICTWLAFFPPRGYRRWVAGARAAA